MGFWILVISDQFPNQFSLITSATGIDNKRLNTSDKKDYNIHFLSFISLISAPAVIYIDRRYRHQSSLDRHVPAKAFSEPVTTIAPTCGSLSNSFNAWLNSFINGLLRALSALGLLSVMRATPGSGRDVRMLVYWVDMRRIDVDTIKRFVWGARRTDRRMRWDMAPAACYT
jgi:hypothetical protein